jgi:hypothetical protein
MHSDFLVFQSFSIYFCSLMSLCLLNLLSVFKPLQYDFCLMISSKLFLVKTTSNLLMQQSLFSPRLAWVLCGPWHWSCPSEMTCFFSFITSYPLVFFQPVWSICLHFWIFLRLLFILTFSVALDDLPHFNGFQHQPYLTIPRFMFSPDLSSELDTTDSAAFLASPLWCFTNL